MKTLIFLFLPLTLTAQSIDSLQRENGQLIHDNRELNKGVVILRALLNEFSDQIDSLKFVNSKMGEREEELLLKIEDLNNLNLELKQLLMNNTADTNIVRMYQMEIETMKKIMRRYIVQIDELQTRNNEQQKEIEELKAKLESNE